MNAVVKELDEFRLEIASWLKANKPQDPGFLLPQSFMDRAGKGSLFKRYLECGRYLVPRFF